MSFDENQHENLFCTEKEKLMKTNFICTCNRLFFSVKKQRQRQQQNHFTFRTTRHNDFFRLDFYFVRFNKKFFNKIVDEFRCNEQLSEQIDRIR